jgi:hypothetical protein
MAEVIAKFEKEYGPKFAICCVVAIIVYLVVHG